MVNALLGDEDETTIATRQVPTIPPQTAASPTRRRLKTACVVQAPKIPSSEVSCSKDPSENGENYCSSTSKLNWLDEAIAAAPLPPVSEREYCSEEEKEETKEEVDSQK
jgi:hypothetical protein